MNTKELLYKFANNEASPQELREFSRYLESLDLGEYQALLTEYGDIIQSISVTGEPNAALFEIISRKINLMETEEGARPATVHRIQFIRKGWVRYAAAAVIVFAVATTYLLLKNNNTQKTEIAQINVTAPKINKARITLGNGKTVYLDSVANGRTIEVDGVRLTKLADGRVVYSGDAATLVYNTASNPRGSAVIDLELGDHTHVWLNAGSSIKYPVTFTGNTRNVNITGEAYFEVAHDKNKPFIVSKGETSVQVLGTHFNVKAYDNDPSLKVTLLEGAVRVTYLVPGTKSQMLAPGQQAIVTPSSIQLVANADTEEAVAWKNGYTNFFSTDLTTLLHEIERWYDIEIEMKADASKAPHDFYVNVKRTAPLKDVLKVLDNSKVKYSYDEKIKRLTILP